MVELGQCWMLLESGSQQGGEGSYLEVVSSRGLSLGYPQSDTLLGALGTWSSALAIKSWDLCCLGRN